MKKIIATLLLLVFTTNIASFAGEVIVIGSDGQARYENESKNIPVSQKVIESTKQKNIMNEVTITDETGKRESIYIDNKGKEKKFCSNQTVGAVSNVNNTKLNNIKEVNYMSEKTNITKEAAISLTYGINVENNPILVEICDIARKNPLYTRKDICYFLRWATSSKEPLSIKRALETKGLMPKYIGSNYYVLEKPEHLNSIIDTYLLLKNHGISEKDMTNILAIYTVNHEQAPIPLSLVSNILDENAINKEDKVYYIYAKLYGLTENNSKIEEDMINAYNIMKKYPQIFKKESDNTTLGDDVYWVMRFNAEKCKTAEILNEVMNDSKVKDNDKLFRVIGKLKVLALKDEEKEKNKKYLPILFEMAEEGRPLIEFWENSASKYYTEEKVLQDVYSAYKLLKNAGIEDLDGDEGTSILTLHPELCKTEEITKSVLNDSKIAKKDKVKMIGRRIEREYYKNRESSYNKTSETAYKAIELGIVPKYTTRNLEDHEYEIKKMTKNIKAYELMKKYPAFRDEDIKFLIWINGSAAGDNERFNLYDSVKKVVNDNNISDKDKPNQVFREFLITENNDNNVKLFDAGIISSENKLYKDTFDFDRGNEQTLRIINAYKLMNKIGFRENDKIYIIDEHASNEYINKAIEDIINDNSIQKDDVFMFANANIKKQEALNKKDMPQSYYKAVEKNIIPLYYNDAYYKEDEFYEKLIENVCIMRDELGFTGKQIEDVWSIDSDKDLHYVSEKDKTDVIHEILIDEKITKDEKIKEIEKKFIQINSKEKSKEDSRMASEEARKTLEKARMTALIVITAPIWLPLAIIFSPILIPLLKDIGKTPH